MNEYVKKMKPIDVPRGFFTHTHEIDEQMIGRVVSLNGQIGWLGSNGRPDVAAGHSIIAGQYNDKSPQLVSSCNQCVKQAQSMDCSMRIWSIKPKDLRFVGFCDSSFDFTGK